MEAQTYNTGPIGFDARTSGPGGTSYGRTKKQATVAVQALALRLIADRLEHGEALPGPMNVSFIAARQTRPELAVHQSEARISGGTSDRLASRGRPSCMVPRRGQAAPHIRSHLSSQCISNSSTRPRSSVRSFRNPDGR